MDNIIERLLKQAEELDAKGLREHADELDSIAIKLATYGGGIKGMQTPEERARHRVMMSGSADDKLYQKYLAEERAKDAVHKTEPVEQPGAAKVREQTGPVLNYTKEQLLNAIKSNPQQEAAIRSHLVPALNEKIGGPKIPGMHTVDVYGKESIETILDAAEKFGLIKKEQGLLSRFFQ